MLINIIMLVFFLIMEEGNLVKWLVKEGDMVLVGDVIVEIEIDKVIMEVEVVDEGMVGKIVVLEGLEGVKVNELIVVFLEDGEDVSVIGLVFVVLVVLVVVEFVVVVVLVVVFVVLVLVGLVLVVNDGSWIFVLLLVWCFVQFNGLDLKVLSGIGLYGWIVKCDIEVVVVVGIGKVVVLVVEVLKVVVVLVFVIGLFVDQVFKFFEEGFYEFVLYDGMCKIIVKWLMEFKQIILYFYVLVDCQFDVLLVLCFQLNGVVVIDKDGKLVYKLLVNDMIIKVLVFVLCDVLDVNVFWIDDNMVKYKYVDVGVVVFILGGLIILIVCCVEEKLLLVIFNEMKDMGVWVKFKKLLLEEYQGGIFVVFNMGMMGVKDFFVVVNLLYVIILVVGVGEKCLVVKDGELVIVIVMIVMFLIDYCCVDGVFGVEFLVVFKGYIENLMSMLV